MRTVLGAFLAKEQASMETLSASFAKGQVHLTTDKKRSRERTAV
jgi:hypothetical protein